MNTASGVWVSSCQARVARGPCRGGRQVTMEFAPHSYQAEVSECICYRSTCVTLVWGAQRGEVALNPVLHLKVRQGGRGLLPGNAHS